MVRVAVLGLILLSGSVLAQETTTTSVEVCWDSGMQCTGAMPAPTRNPLAFEPLSINVTVTNTNAMPMNGAPSGTVDVSIGGALSCDDAVLGPATALTSTATCPVTAGPGAGASIQFSAIYTPVPAANFASSSNNVSQTVDKADSTVTIDSIAPATNRKAFQTFDVNFSVNAVAPSVGTVSSGTASITWGPDSCSATVSAGSGNCDTDIDASEASTTNDVVVTYTGNANFNPASPVTQANVVVEPAVTVVSIDSIVNSMGNASPLEAFNEITITASVSATGSDGSGAQTPPGTVTVSRGSEGCVITLAAGTGSCSYTPLAAGTANLTASYAASGNFAADSATQTGVVVNPATTLVTIASDDPDPSISNKNFTVVFNVTLPNANPMLMPAATPPPGSVQITHDAGMEMCTDNLSAGAGMCDLKIRAIGNRTLTATYTSTNGNYASGSTDTEPHVVAPRQVDLSVVKTNSLNAITPESAFEYSITITHETSGSMNQQGLGAADVRLTDIFPPQLTAQAFNPLNNQCPNNGASGLEICWQYCEITDYMGTDPLTPANCEAENGTLISLSGDINPNATPDVNDVIISIPEGKSVVVVAYVRLATGISSGTVTNTASVSLKDAPDDVDPTPGNNTSTDSDPVETVATVQLDKKAVDAAGIQVSSVTPGETVTYLITLDGDNSLDADGIQVDDLFPIYSNGGTPTVFTDDTPGFLVDAVNKVRWSCSAGPTDCCLSNGAGPAQCGTGPNGTALVAANSISRKIDLSAQGQIKFRVTGTLDPRSRGTLNNEFFAVLPANVSVGGTPDTISDPESTMIQPLSDLEIRKNVLTVDDSITMLADRFTIEYRIEVTNLGPSFASSITVTDLFDDEPFTDMGGAPAAIVDWDCSLDNLLGNSFCPPDQDGQTNLTAAGLRLDPGDTAVFIVTVDNVRNPDDPTVDNTASVSHQGGIANDPQPGNNSASATTSLKGDSNILVTKDDGVTTSVPGTDVSYQIVITNMVPPSGPVDNVFGALVTDAMSSKLENVTWSCDANTPIPGDLNFDRNYPLGEPLDTDGDSMSDLFPTTTAFAISQDGINVFVVDEESSKLTVLRRVNVPGRFFGELTLEDEENEGIDDTSDIGPTVIGMDTPRDVIISPDGRNVYVAGAASSAITQFNRSLIPNASDFATVSFTNVYYDGDLSTVTSLAMDALGNSFYAAAFQLNDDMTSGTLVVNVYGRDLASGALSLKQTLATTISAPVDPVTGLVVYPRPDLLVSPDGTLVVLAAADHLISYRRENQDPGTLGTLGTGPQFAPLFDNTSIATRAAQLLFGQSGNKLYLADDMADTIHIMDVNPDGSLGVSIASPAITAVGVNSLSLASDGEHLVAGALGVPGDPMALSTLMVFRLLPASGALLPEQELMAGVSDDAINPQNGVVVRGMDGLNGVAFTSDGRHVMAIGSADNDLVVFARQAPDPLFAFIENEKQGRSDGIEPEPVDGLFGAAAVVVSPDKKHVYVAGLGDGTLAVFARDPKSGQIAGTQGRHLDYLRNYRQGGMDNDLPPKTIQGLDSPRALAFNPDGDLLYVASERNNSVTGFRRASDGTLIEIETLVDDVNGADGLLGVAGLAVDPGGKFLYTAGQFDAAIGVYAINDGTGTAPFGSLTFVQVAMNGTAGIIGLGGVFDLEITSDGQHLIAAASFDDGLVVFSIGTNGTLTYLGRFTFADESIFDRPIALALDGDDRFVYVAAANSNSVAVFERNTDSTNLGQFGRLRPVTVYQDGATQGPTNNQITISGIRGARDVRVSEDGGRVFVAGENDSSVVIFDRNQDPVSLDAGTLTWLDKREEGIDGVAGISQIRALAVSGRHVYAVGLQSNALAAFSLGLGSRCTQNGSGDINDRVDIGIGGTITYTVNGRIRSDAKGQLDNTASVTLPPNFVDADPSDGEMDTDTNALDPLAELTIKKDDGRLSVTPGGQVTYTIRVGNAGPSNVTSIGPNVNDVVSVIDLFSTNPAFEPGSASWSCEAVGSGSINQVQFVLTPDDPAITTDFNSLDGVSNVAILPDLDGSAGLLPEYVIGAGVLANSLNFFERDALTGQLTLARVLTQGDLLGPDTLTKLTGVRDVAVSPQFAPAALPGDPPTHALIFAVSQFDDSIQVFRAEAVDDNGTNVLGLSLVQVLLNGMTDGNNRVVDGLNGATAIAVSPVDNRLFVASSNADTLAIFNFDPGSGELFFAEIETNGVNDSGDSSPAVTGMDGANDVTVSTDGNTVYVAAANSGAVVVFEKFEAGMEAVRYLQTVDVNNGFDLAGASSVRYFSADLDNNGTDDVRTLYAGAADSSALAVIFANPDGTLDTGNMANQYFNAADDQIPGLLGLRDITVAPDGNHLYLSGQRHNSVSVFTRNLETGELTLRNTLQDGSAGNENLRGAAGLVMSPDGQFLYNAAATSDAISTFKRIADTFCPLLGQGDINAAVNIGVGGEVIFTATATVSENAALNGNVDTITLPSGDVVAVVLNSASLEVVSADADDPTDLLVNDPDAPFVLQPCFNDPMEMCAVLTDDDTSEFDSTADLAITKSDGRTQFNGLAAASDVVTTDVGDDRHVYVAGADDNAIGILKIRNPTMDDDRHVVFLTSVVSGQDGAAGLTGVAGLAISPDGEHLYAAGALDSALAVFARDSKSGNLTLLELQENGVLGVSGINGIAAIAVSVDGEHVYAVGRNVDSMAIFSRENDPMSADFGRLTFIQVIQNGVDSVTGMIGPAEVIVSPDGNNVYVAAPGNAAIVAFDRNNIGASNSFGKLTYRATYANSNATVAGLAGVSGLAFSRDPMMPANDGLFLYASAAVDGSVVVFQRSPTTGALTQLEFKNSQSPDVVGGLSGASDVVVSADGAHLYVTGANDHSLVSFEIQTDGRLMFLDVVNNGDPAGGQLVAGLGGASALVLSETDDLVFAVGADDATLGTFERDSNDASGGFGSVQFTEAIVDGRGGVQPGEELVYVISVTNNGPSNVEQATIMDVFSDSFVNVTWVCQPDANPVGTCVTSGSGSINQQVDLEAGATIIFSATALVKPGVSGVLSNTATITLPAGVTDPNITNNSATDADTVLTPEADLRIGKSDVDLSLCTGIPPQVRMVDGTAGEPLSYTVTVENCGPSFVGNADLEDFVPEQLSSPTWTCLGTPLPGLLDLASSVNQMLADSVYTGDLTTYRASAVSPDGAHVYAIGETGGLGGLVIYDRDSSSGVLRFNDQLQDGLDGVSGLTGGIGLLFSPDGGQLFVASNTADAIVIFDRDDFTGALTFVASVQNGAVLTGGTDPVSGLGGATDMAIASDGRHLYVTGTEDDAIAIFRRETDGGVTFLGSIQQSDPIPDLDGLLGARGIAISPDGANVYVAGSANQAIAVFTRDSGTGLLTFLDVVFDTPAISMTEPWDLVINPAGDRLFVSSQISNTVLMFARDNEMIREPDSGLIGNLTFLHERTLEPFSDPMNLIDGVPGLSRPKGLAIDSTGRKLYVGAQGSNAITLFRVDETRLKYQAFFDTMNFASLTHASQPTLSPNGNNLYVAGDISESLTAFRVKPGSLCTDQGSGNIIDVIDVSVGGRVVYTIGGIIEENATGSMSNVASVYPRLPVVDTLLTNNEAEAVTDLSYVYDLAVDKTDDAQQPDPMGGPLRNAVVAGRENLYMIDIDNDGLSTAFGAEITDSGPVTTDDPAIPGFVDGSESWMCLDDRVIQGVTTLFDATATTTLAGARRLILSSSGLFAYAVASDADTVTVFARDAVFGTLTIQQTVTDGDMVANPDPEMTDMVPVRGLDLATDLVISPDGTNLYVTGRAEDTQQTSQGAVAIFAIDPVSGLLAWKDVKINDNSPVNGMRNPSGLIFSEDGNVLYVAGTGSNSVVRFTRTAMTGLLTYQGRVRDGFGTVAPNFNVMQGPTELLISSDQRFLYVAAGVSNAVAVFSRGTDGVLTYVDSLRSADLTGTGFTLDGVSSIAASFNGSLIYAVSPVNDTLMVLSRNTDTGVLQGVAAYQQGMGGITGLTGAVSVAVAADSDYVYVAAQTDGLVSVFRRDWPNETLIQRDQALAPGDIPFGAPAQVVIGPISSAVYVVGNAPGSISRVTTQPASDCPGTGAAGDIDTLVFDAMTSSGLTFALNGTVHPSARGYLDNTASLAPNMVASDPNLVDNDSTDRTIIDVETDLAIDKTGPVGDVLAGTTIEYTIVVSNAGISNALQAIVTDSNPVLSNFSWTCVPETGAACTASASGQAGLDDRVDIPVGSSVTYTVTALIDPDFRGLLDNTAVVDPELPIILDAPDISVVTDPDLSNNSSTWSNNVIGESNLGVTKDNGVTTLIPGQTFVYMIDVTNTGPSTAIDALVTDQPPVELINITWTCVPTGNATCSANGVDFIMDTVFIPPNDSLHYEITATVDLATPLGSQISNTVTVAVDDLSGEFDPNLTNNTATDTDDIQVNADLSVTKDDAIDPLDPTGINGIQTYTITVTNNGPSDAVNLVLTDLPPVTDPLLFSGPMECLPVLDQGVMTAVECTRANLVIGDMWILMLDFDYTGQMVGDTLVNDVSVTSDTIDPIPENNADSEDTLLAVGLDIQTTKSDGASQVQPSQNLVYTIVVRNVGADPASQVTITDIMPAELVGVSWTCVEDGGATCQAASGMGDINHTIALPALAGVTYTVNAQVDPVLLPNSGIPIINTVDAVVGGGDTDANPGNNSATDTDLILSSGDIFKDSFEDPTP